MIESYRDLEVWQLAMEIIEGVYRCTAAFPRDEVFGLTAQSRRSAVSIASNIAEGWGRGSTGDYVRLLRYANGSVKELETQMEAARRLGFGRLEDVESILQLLDREGRMLRGLIRSLEDGLQ